MDIAGPQSFSDKFTAKFGEIARDDLMQRMMDGRSLPVATPGLRNMVTVTNFADLPISVARLLRGMHRLHTHLMGTPSRFPLISATCTIAPLISRAILFLCPPGVRKTRVRERRVNGVASLSKAREEIHLDARAGDAQLPQDLLEA